MNGLLVLAAGTEVVTGLVLIVAPSVFARLLFGENLSGPGRWLGTLGGMGLLALASACWPVRNGQPTTAPAFRGMLFFSLLAALYLIYRGVVGAAIGPLLWPAAVFHAILALLLARAWLRLRSVSRPNQP